VKRSLQQTVSVIVRDLLLICATTPPQCSWTSQSSQTNSSQSSCCQVCGDSLGWANVLAATWRLECSWWLYPPELGNLGGSRAYWTGATENARPDIARPSKLWKLTSRDWTTRHHIVRVDIARLVSLCE